MEDDGVTFTEADEFRDNNAEKLDFRFILMEHLRKVLTLSCNEWKGGYNLVDSRGKQTYIPDTRAEYWNAVDALADLCLPHFDKKTKEKFNEINQKEKELFNLWHKRKEYNGLVMPIPIFDGAEEKYKDQKLIYKRKLFQLINLFLKQSDYFKAKYIIDDIGD